MIQFFLMVVPYPKHNHLFKSLQLSNLKGEAENASQAVLVEMWYQHLTSWGYGLQDLEQLLL